MATILSGPQFRRQAHDCTRPPCGVLLCMRSAVALSVVLFGLCVSASAADRKWQTGAWAAPTEAGAYVIETARDVITGEAAGGSGEPALASAPGSRVQFAIDGKTLYVLDADKVEHALTLLGSVAKYSNTYAALGGGHYVTSVASGGTSITLEDGSRWDMDPGQHFAIAGWQADDLISVRRSTSSPAFAYEVDNTSQDDGALANHRAR